MLDTLSAADFEPLEGKRCVLVLSDQCSIEATIRRVEVKPACRSPRSNTQRMPFTVWLSAHDDQPIFDAAICSLRTGSSSIEGVYINRFVLPEAQEDGAWYQLIFN